jgi:hypothetical protein
MRTEQDIRNHGVAIRPVDDYRSARIFVDVGGKVSLSIRVNVQRTLNMSKEESDVYKVAYAGTYVEMNGKVDEEWGRLVEQLQRIREHVCSLMRLQEDIRTLDTLKGGTT